jgi:ankyrin repeat protein
MTDLYDAANDGDLERVTLLVEHGVDKNLVGGLYDQTSLSIATSNNHFAVVQYLVEQGADMDKSDKYGQSPLLLAASNGHLEVTRYLLEQGADRDKPTTSAGLLSTMLLTTINWRQPSCSWSTERT